VDHPLRAPDALVRPWRTAAYVAVAIAAVELLLLLLIGGGKVLGWASDRMQLAARDHVLQPATQTTQTKAAAREHTAAPATTRPRSKTIVLVLNGNGRTGAAAAAASRVHARGYRIGTVTNAPARVPRSIVMYRPGFAGEGRRLGKDLGVKLVTPLDGMRAKDLGRSQVVFILGP
jgi:hypothetical protein